MSLPWASRLAAALGLCALFLTAARAGTYYWDANGTVSGAGAAPSGTWTTGGTTWTIDPSGSSPMAGYTTTASDDLYFVAGPSGTSGAGAYTVTVNGTVSADSLNFQASGATAISGGTLLNLYAGGIDLPQYAYGTTNNAAVTISTPLSLQVPQTWTNNSSTSLTVSGTVTDIGGPLTTAGSGITTLSGAIAGPGGIIVNGGVLVLSGADTYSGGTTVSAGTLQLANGYMQGNVTNNATVAFTGTGYQMYAGVVSGGGALVVNGPYALVLTGSNTYTGGTTISSGTMQLGDGNASNGYVPGNITDNGTLTIANASDQTFTGVISGSGSFTKAGSGTLTLSASNRYTYTGSTYVNGGTLLLDFSAAGAPKSNIVNYAGGSPLLDVGGGTLSIKSASTGSANSQQFGNLALGVGASTIRLNANGNPNVPNLSIGDIFTGLGSCTLLLDTSLGGTVTTATWTANQIYSGRVVYYNGSGYDWATTTTGYPYAVSQASTTAALPASGATSTANYLLTDNGSGVTASETINTLKVTTTAAGKSLSISPGQLLTLGAGGLLLTGSNDYTISGGSITAGNLPIGTNNAPYEFIIQQYAPNSNLTISSTIADNGGHATMLTKAGPGTLTLSGVNTCSAGANVLSGTLSIVGGTLDATKDYIGGSAAATVTQSAGTHTVANWLYLGYNPGQSGTYNLSGAGRLSSTWLIVGNLGTGTFTQSGGTNTATYTEIGRDPGAVGTFGLNDPSLLSGTYEYVGEGGTGTLTQSGGTNTMTMGVWVGSNIGSSGTYILNGPGQLSAPNEYVGYFGAGVFTQSDGTNAVAQPGNLYIGYYAGASGCYNLNGGTLVVPGISQGSGNAAFNFNGGTLMAGGTFSTALPIALATSGASGTVDTAGYTVTLSGPISGPGGLIKAGTGTLILTGPSTYTGTTAASAGTLVLGAGGSLGNTVISVAGGATFAPRPGSGAVVAGLAGPGTSGATLSLAGGSVFDMTDAALGIFNLDQQQGFNGTAFTLNGATLKFDLGSGGADQLVVNQGAASLAGTNTIGISFLTGALTPGTYTLISAPSGLSGTFDFANGQMAETVTTGGHTYRLQLQNFDTGEQVVVSTPEPSTIALLGAGALGLVGWARRRRLLKAPAP